MSKTVYVTSSKTTAELEARNTADDPIRVYDDHLLIENRNCGDDVILTSKDGDTFIGHIAEVDYDRGVFYTELD